MTVLEIFKMDFCLRDRHIFIWQSLQILNIFITLTLKQVFWKKENFKEKLVHRFFVESTTTENPKTYVKTDRMENKKWIYPKKLNLPLTTLFFENLICV